MTSAARLVLFEPLRAVAGNSSGSPPQISMPLLSTPLVDAASGVVTPPWHRVLIELFKRLGGSQANTPSGVYFQLNAGGQIVVYSVATNAIIGVLSLTGGVAPPVEPIVLVPPSPEIFKATF